MRTDLHFVKNLFSDRVVLRGVRGLVWNGLRFGLDPPASMRFEEKSTRNRPQCSVRFVRIGFADVRAGAGGLLFRFFSLKINF